MRHGRRGATPRSRNSKGFTLFEMVVVICSIVILYMVAEERLNQLPAAAERASFYAVLEQIKTGVNFEMVTKLAAGRRSEIMAMEGTNPMDYLIEAPANYRGELVQVTDNVDRRNAWYFETSTGELVYVLGASSIEDVLVNVAGAQVKFGQIRLKIKNVYAGEDSRGQGSTDTVEKSAAEAEWDGLLLVPVREYTWNRSPEGPVPLN